MRERRQEMVKKMWLCNRKGVDTFSSVQYDSRQVKKGGDAHGEEEGRQESDQERGRQESDQEKGRQEEKVSWRAWARDRKDE